MFLYCGFDTNTKLDETMWHVVRQSARLSEARDKATHQHKHRAITNYLKATSNPSVLEDYASL